MLVISVNRAVILFVKTDNIRINIFALRTSMTCLHHDLENVKMANCCVLHMLECTLSLTHLSSP